MSGIRELVQQYNSLMAQTEATQEKLIEAIKRETEVIYIIYEKPDSIDEKPILYFVSFDQAKEYQDRLSKNNPEIWYWLTWVNTKDLDEDTLVKVVCD